jgi:hypothetical protein
MNEPLSLSEIGEQNLNFRHEAVSLVFPLINPLRVFLNRFNP